MSLVLKIFAEKEQYLPGESIPVRMTLQNIGDTVVAIPDFSYNSNLTEVLVKDSDGNEIGRANDYVRQQLLGFMTLETIRPAEKTISPGMELNVNLDLSQYIRLLKSQVYYIQGSFKYDDNELLSEPVGIKILDGKASMLRHAWQYQMASKWKCHIVYRDHDQLMHMFGNRNNPEVIDFNRPVKTAFDVDSFFLAYSCYDVEDSISWIAGVKGDKLLAGRLNDDQIQDQIENIKLEGELAGKGVVENFEEMLIVPVILKDKGKLKFYMFDRSGKKSGEKEIDAGGGTYVLDAATYKTGEFLMIYGEQTDRGSDIYAAVATKPDLSDMKVNKLVGSSKRFDAAVIPPSVKMPGGFYAVSFDPLEKNLMIYTVSLNPDIRTAVPPKTILKSEGDLAFQSAAFQPNGAAYLLFVEGGNKLLYYNFADNEFKFITEDKFSDPQLIVTESDGVFLAYIDNQGLVRFKHMEVVVKRH